MILTYLMLLAGLALLFFGGELLVRGSVALATKMGLSSFVIGLTVVGFGTSTPELLVSLAAALKGQPDISVGNVVGSNIANVLLILGVAAVISPVVADFVKMRRDMIVVILTSVALLALATQGELGRIAGAIMVAALVGYLYWLVRHAPNDDVPDIETKPMGGLAMAASVLGGLVALMVGADWMVDSSVAIARQFGISEAVIGLTIVAVGTSLPELATSVVAAIRRQNDIAIGNVLGSNFFNILGILGVTAMVSPLKISSSIAAFDIPVMLAVIVLLFLVVWKWHKVGRWVGAAFLVAYGAYVLTLF